MTRRRYDNDDDDDDDEYEDRPRRGSKGGLPVLLIVGIVAGTILACGGLAGGYFLFAREMSKPRPVAPLPAPAPPVAVAPAPTDPPPANALATVVLVRRSRPTDPKPKLEVTYRFDKATGQFDQFDLVFELEGATGLESGKATVPLRAGTPGETQTIQVEKELGFVDLSRARAKVWIQKRLTPAEPAERVSNVFKL